jgi:DNA-binding GntR family transcriptional regulator
VIEAKDRRPGEPWRPQRVSTADAVYQHLREAIISGQFGPGTRLREVELSARLGVSRTPLREAIARLIGDRLVRRARGGVEVIDLISERIGIYHIRVALEAYASRLAATRITDDELARVQQLLERSIALPPDAIEERVLVNNQFHSLVFRASGVAQLVRAIETYGEYFIDERGLQRFGPKETRKAVADHRAIVSALRRRDGDEAERLTRRHLLAAFDTISQE